MMAKQVRAPRSTKKIGVTSVTSDRNKIKNASLPKSKHERSDASNVHNPTRIKPGKG